MRRHHYFSILPKDSGIKSSRILKNGINWYYFGARYYDPAIGRWLERSGSPDSSGLSVDPLAEMYPSLSPFVYCGNNPIVFFDPNGTEVRGDSADIEDAAKKINEALKDKNIKNASASRKTKEVEKTGLEWLWAIITGGSLTKTVHYLSLDGEGWNKISASDPLLTSEENSLATEAFKMLREIVNSKEIWKYHFTDVSPDGNSLAIFYGGGFNDGKGNVYVSPLGNLNTQSRNYG